MQKSVLLKIKYNAFSNINTKYGLSKDDESYFGDRAPEGYEKVRLVSKMQHTVFWMFRQTKTVKHKCGNTNVFDEYFVVQ